MAEPVVITEEDYLSQNGACRQSIGDVALHKQPGSTPNSRARLSKMQSAKDHKLLIKRGVLRKEYRERVAKGELRPPTAAERRLELANGHPDRDDVQAARRILKRRGIPFTPDDGRFGPALGLPTEIEEEN